jgi:hypothetical protein
MKQIFLKYGETCLVDDEDFDKLIGEIWFLTNQGYASASIDGKVFAMHHLVLRAEIKLAKQEVDHIDRNKLNNQKNNLRVVDRRVNNYNQNKRKDNTSGFKGIRWQETHNSWRARSVLNGKEIHLGYFKTLQEAIDARANFEKKEGLKC